MSVSLFLHALRHSQSLQIFTEFKKLMPLHGSRLGLGLGLGLGLVVGKYFFSTSRKQAQAKAAQASLLLGHVLLRYAEELDLPRPSGTCHQIPRLHLLPCSTALLLLPWLLPLEPGYPQSLACLLQRKQCWALQALACCQHCFVVVELLGCLKTGLVGGQPAWRTV